MDEMNEIREFLPDPGSPTMQATMRAQARLTAEFAQPHPEPARHRPAPWRRWRYALLAAGVAGAAAAAVIAPTMLNGNVDKAYAVERLPNGTIKVTLREFTDAAGLQRKLNALGVRVAVDYLPIGMRCTEPRATVDHTQDLSEVLTPGPPGLERLRDYTFYIHPERIRPGQTLVWTMNFDRNILTQKTPRRYGVGTEYLAHGPVKPCKPVVFILPRPH